MLRYTINFLVFTLLTCGLTRGDYFEECENADSSFVGVDENCALYIFCHDDDSYQDECPEDSPYFSATDQTCDTNSAVCENRPYIGMEIPVVPEVPVAPVAPVEIITTTTTVTPVITNTPFSIPTASSNITTSTTLAAIVITPSPPSTVVVAMACPAIDDPSKAIFLANPKSCSDYFLCYHGAPLAMRCSNMLHYDSKQQKCDYPENVGCQLESVTPRDQCMPHIFDVFPHPNNCNYYYLCSYGYLMVMQCPLRMGWDYEKRACSLLPQAKCYNSLQRLKI